MHRFEAVEVWSGLTEARLNLEELVFSNNFRRQFMVSLWEGGWEENFLIGVLIAGFGFIDS